MQAVAPTLQDKSPALLSAFELNHGLSNHGHRLFDQSLTQGLLQGQRVDASILGGLQTAPLGPGPNGLELFSGQNAQT